ncbi:hypothetical protein C1H46_036405 [Malus baccata]|uniref:Sey1/RHD3-like three-helix bundle domain-containing protein n=1 Tax=Malus baccata TaxID=106549 RepID=A0A540KV00_MALBA|nr:hypothetical protein C1H46_036405 [Malus baccata]
MKQHLKDYARNWWRKKAGEEAGKIMIHMKDRFALVFNYDSDSMPRVWTGNEDIRSITKDARTAVIIGNFCGISEAFVDHGCHSLSSSQNRKLGPSTDPLASSSWEEVSSKDTLITPVQCKSLSRQFKAETEYSVTQAISAQEAHKRSNNWLPPPWAIMAMLVLGFNEFMMLLKNPLYLMVLFVAFLLSKALWVQMDITGQFQHDALSGILSISSRFLPTVMNILRKLAEEAQGNQTPEAQRRPVSLSSQSYRSETPQPNPVTSSFPESSVSSNILSSDTGMEYSSPPLRQRRTANVEEEAHKRSNNWLPPPWAIMVMIVLGFNEFMMLLKNPLYLMVLFVAFLLSKALWVQMDITGQFQHDALSGILSISSRFLPTVMNILRKLAEEAQGNQTPEAQRQPVSLSSQSYRSETPQPNPVTSSFPESSVSSNILSSDTGMEYSSPPLRQRRTANVEEVESS